MWDQILNSMVDENNKASSQRISLYTMMVLFIVFAISSVVFMFFGRKDVANHVWTIAMFFGGKGLFDGAVAQFKSASVAKSKAKSGSLQVAPPPTPDPSDFEDKGTGQPEPKLVEVKDSKRLSKEVLDVFALRKRKVKRLLATITLLSEPHDVPRGTAPQFLLKPRKDRNNETQKEEPGPEQSGAG